MQEKRVERKMRKGAEAVLVPEGYAPTARGEERESLEKEVKERIWFEEKAL